MSDVSRTLDDLAHRNPEWRPWLKVIGEIVEEAQRPAWEEMVPRASRRDTQLPLLASATIAVDGRVGRLFARLADCAATSGSPALRTLAAVRHGPALTRDVFRAALVCDDAALTRIATAQNAGPAAFQAVASLVPLPFLHACARVWKDATLPSWAQGYCPVCGAWPSHAEICGVERKRCLRCVRCGSAWETVALRCPYCGTRDHASLAALMSEEHSPLSIELCNRCMGYWKVLMKLQQSPPAAVALDDLASVELDIAAAARGYARPRGTGGALEVAVNPAA